MTDSPAREQLQQHLRAPHAPQLIYLAVKLGIPDLLRDGPRSSADLAPLVHAHAPALHRVLRGMVVIGLLNEEDDGCFALTPQGALLQQNHPDSLYDDALITGELYPVWCGLLQTVQTGTTAFDAVFGCGLFSYFANHPTLEASFNRQMAGMTRAIVSPDKPRRDTEEKPLDYAEVGIPEYWIVNPLDETITVLTLAGGVYMPHGIFRRGARAASKLLDGFSVYIDDVFDAQ